MAVIVKGGMNFISDVASGGTGHILDTDLSYSGGKLLSVRTGSSEVTYIDYTGALHTDVIAEHSTDTGVTIDGVLLKDNTMSLSYLGNPTGDKTIAMTTRTLKFLWTAPAGNPMELEASGAYTGALLHIHQHTGNPGSAYLLALEASDTDIEFIGATGVNTSVDVLCTYVSGDTEERYIIHADGSLAWGPGGVTSTDTTLYRSAAGTLKTDGNLSVVGNITDATWTADTIGIAYGGTNLTTYTTGDILYASATNTLSKLGIGTTGQVLTSSGTAIIWGDAGGGDVPSSRTLTINGTTDEIDVTGGTQSLAANRTWTVGIAATFAGQTSITTLGTISAGTWHGDTIAYNYGGTGLTSYASGDVLFSSGTNNLTKLSIGSTGQVLKVVGGVGSQAGKTKVVELLTH